MVFFWLSLLGDLLTRGELSFKLSSCGWLHTLLPDTHRCLPAALTFRRLCYMTPFLTLLRTRGFWTVKKGPIRQFRPRGLCFEPAFKELWSLSALTYQAFRQAEMISCPVIRGGRGYKATPHLPWQALKATTLFTFLLPPISHYAYKPQLYLYPGFFGLFF